MLKFDITRTTEGVLMATLTDTVGNTVDDISGSVSVDFGRNDVKVQTSYNTTHIHADVVSIDNTVYTKLFNGSFVYID